MQIPKAFRYRTAVLVAPFGVGVVDLSTCAGSALYRMSRRARNCRVDAQETVALGTPAFHQTSSPTRYPGFTILTIRPLLCLPPPVELLPRRCSGHAEAKGKYGAFPDWMLRERRHGGGNIGDADSSIFSICQACQALQPRGFVLYGELGCWLYDVVGAFFRQSFN